MSDEMIESLVRRIYELYSLIVQIIEFIRGLFT